MSSPEEYAKRRLTETNKQNPEARPHKKRLASRPSSPALGSEGGDNENSGSNDLLEGLQKEAITIQWKEYMRLQKRWEVRMEHAKGRTSQSSASLQIWEAQFKQWQTDLKLQLNQQVPEYIKTHLEIDESLRKHILTSDWATDYAVNTSAALERRGLTEPRISQIAEVIDAWVSSREALAKSLESALESMKERKHRYRNVMSAWVNGQRSIYEKNVLVRQANAKLLLLLEEHRFLTARTNTIHTIWENTRHELDDAQRKNAKNEEVLPENEEQQRDGSVEVVQKEEPVDETMDDAKEIDEQETSLTESKQALNQQLQEIDLIKEQRIELKQAISRLEFDLMRVPESAVSKSYPQLYEEREYQQNKSNRADALVAELREAVKKAAADRHRSMDEMDAEQMLNSSKDLWDQLRKLEADVMQIRGERDALEIEKDRVKSSEKCYIMSLQALSPLTGPDKKKVAALEGEVCRLQRKRIAKTGIRHLYKFIMNTTDADFSLEQQLQTEISEMEKRLQEAKATILSSSAMDDETQQWMDKELHWATKFKRLEKETSDFAQKYGFDPASTKEKDVLQTLQDSLKSEEDNISNQRKELKSLEANEAQLLSEIESISKACDEGEEQKFKELEQQEKRAVAVEKRRVKYTELFNALNKSFGVHLNVSKALEKQTKKQLEYIGQLQEREKCLNNHSSSLDRALQACEAARDNYDGKGAEAEKSLKDLDDAIALANKTAKEWEESIVEKIRLVEEGAHARLRLEENSELLRRKIDVSAKVDRPVGMKRKEKEEYQTLLNCSSCRSQLKSHVLMRCMHMFCESCLNTLIEKRQRHCPSCDEPFAVSDMKQLFFN